LERVIDSLDKIQTRVWTLKSYHLAEADSHFLRIQNDVGQALRVFAELEHSKVENGRAFQKKENKQVVCSLLDYLHQSSKVSILLFFNMAFLDLHPLKSVQLVRTRKASKRSDLGRDWKV